MTVYDSNFEGRKAGLYPELFSALTNPTSPQAWLQLALHVWDVAQMEKLRDTILGRLEQRAKDLLSKLEELKTKTDEALVKLAYDEARAYMRLEVFEQAQMLKLGKDFPMSASISRLGWNMEQYLRLYDAYKSAVINIPSEYGLLIPAERYWRKFYARGRPSFRDAFIMACKELVSWDLPYQILTEDIGMSETLAKAFIKHAYYDPTPSELARIHRSVPLPSKYVVRKLKNVGVSDEDLGYYAAWIAKEAVKDELITVSRILQDEYAMGTLGAKEFEDFHREWLFSEDEIKLRKTTAQILRAKYVLKLRRDAKIYLYRRGILTEDQLYEELKKLGIADEVANAIVENEAAKKGIVWSK
jgi:hypothetical protein